MHSLAGRRKLKCCLKCNFILLMQIKVTPLLLFFSHLEKSRAHRHAGGHVVEPGKIKSPPLYTLVVAYTAADKTHRDSEQQRAARLKKEHRHVRSLSLGVFPEVLRGVVSEFVLWSHDAGSDAHNLKIVDRGQGSGFNPTTGYSEELERCPLVCCW